MPAIIIALLTSLTGPLIQLIFKAVGVGIVSYIGFGLVVDVIEGYIVDAFDGWPTVVVQLLNLAGLDSAIKILLGALAGCASYKALVNSTGIAWKKPGSPSVFEA
jgi:hypothetical protein